MSLESWKAPIPFPSLNQRAIPILVLALTARIEERATRVFVVFIDLFQSLDFFDIIRCFVLLAFEVFCPAQKISSPSVVVCRETGSMRSSDLHHSADIDRVIN